MKTNFFKTLNALNSASDKVRALKAELNKKARDELAELIDSDYDILIDLRYRIYDNKLSIVLYYVKQASTRDPRDLEENCDWGNLISCYDWGNLIISTPATGEKIDRLIKFCELHIWGITH